MTRRFTENPYYGEYEALLKELHRLIAGGQGDSEEADRIRDEMDRPERELNRDELARLNGLSADLYMLQDDEVFEKVDPSEGTPERIIKALQDAWQRADWETVLELLRKGPPSFSSDRVAYLRARAYEALGHLDTSLLFMEYASRLNPEEPIYRSMLMEQLLKLGRLDEARSQAESYIVDANLSPDLLIQSASVLYSASRSMPKETAQTLYMQAIKVLQRALPEAEASARVPAIVVASGFVTMGFCYEALDQPEEALGSFDSALRVEPGSNLALVARGLLRVKSDLPAAIEDFEQAVADHTPSLAPYVHLAHYYLTKSEYERCLRLCDRILLLTNRPGVLAAVLQWAAIAQFELGASLETVQSNFETALALDPLNEHIQQNVKQFRSLSVSKPLAQKYQVEWPLIRPLDLEEVRSKPALFPHARAA